MDSRRPPIHPVRIVLAALLLGFAALMIQQFGEGSHIGEVLLTGGIRELEPAEFRSPPLRSARGGADRIYLLGLQSESIVRIRLRGTTDERRLRMLHVDLWAIGAADLRVAWRRRLRTYANRELEGLDQRGFDLLGADGSTLWLFVDGPVGVSLADGRVVADGARIDARNPAFAGRRVDQPGYVAFGRHGLQLTLDDASQWRIDGEDLSAAPRDTPARVAHAIAPPADFAPTNDNFVLRGMTFGERWLGLLTDDEATLLRNEPTIPGRDPHERPGALQRFLEENHVPGTLTREAKPYRLWSASVQAVSAAPPDWPKELPNRWSTRPAFSNYAVLPDAPVFLTAGLLREHHRIEQALWYRDPDSVLVLHPDRLGEAGRLQLTRVSGPRGAVAWNAALPYTRLESVMRGERDLVLLGSEPGPSPDPRARATIPHQRIVRLDIASGRIVERDLTAESLLPFEGSDAR